MPMGYVSRHRGLFDAQSGETEEVKSFLFHKAQVVTRSVNKGTAREDGMPEDQQDSEKQPLELPYSMKKAPQICIMVNGGWGVLGGNKAKRGETTSRNGLMCGMTNAVQVGVSAIHI